MEGTGAGRDRGLYTREVFQGKGKNMNVAEWEIDKIRPYEKNLRQNEDAVDKDAASIKELG